MVFRPLLQFGLEAVFCGSLSEEQVASATRSISEWEAFLLFMRLGFSKSRGRAIECLQRHLLEALKTNGAE